MGNACFMHENLRKHIASMQYVQHFVISQDIIKTLLDNACACRLECEY